MSLLDNFFNIFRPKWKHSDPGKRADAVRDLADDDLRALGEVARHDADARIRRIAIKKIADARLLAEIAGQEPDEAIKRLAADKADELLIQVATGHDEARAQEALGRIAGPRSLVAVIKGSPLDSIRRSALGRLSDERAIADVAKSAADVGARRLALERIQDVNLLRDIAVRDTSRDVGLAALDKIADTAALQEIARRAKNRAVREAARDRLPPGVGKAEKSRKASKGPVAESRPGEVSPEARRQARRLQLCREAEQAATIADLVEADAALARVRAEFESLGQDEDEARKRFDKAAHRLELRHQAHEEALHRAHEEDAEQRRREAAEEQDAAARLAIIEKVEALDGDGLRHQVEAFREEWQALGRASRKELFQRFKKACDAALRRSELALSRARLREKMEALAVEADGVGAEGMPWKEAETRLRDLQKRWRQLEAAGADEALKARLGAAEERVARCKVAEQARRQADEDAAAVRLEELCAHLEGFAATEDRKAAEHELKVVQAAFESAKGRGARVTAARERYGKARDAVQARLAELREAENWKRWANVPKLEKLCERMEALKEAADPKEAAAQMKALQAEWKTVGPAPKERSEALWARFKAASDEVYKKAHEGFEKLDAERGENLKKKEDLCVRADGVVAEFEAAAQTATPAAWTETSEKLKALQAEWRSVGPAPREQNEEIWKRFRAICDRFFDKRKEHAGKSAEARQENLKKLEALCVRAEALVEGALAAEGRPGVQPKWKETADQMKKLQAEWKAVGAVPRGESKALWKRFRQACDRFFEHRKVSFEKADEERLENLKKKEALCERAEQLAASEDKDAAMSEAKALQAEWKKIGQAPKDQADAVWRRFRAACDRIFDRGQKPAEDTELTVEDRAKIAAYGKFENRLPLAGVLAQLKGEPNPATETVATGSAVDTQGWEEPPDVEVATTASAAATATPAVEAPTSSAVDTHGWEEPPDLQGWEEPPDLTSEKKPG